MTATPEEEPRSPAESNPFEGPEWRTEREPVAEGTAPGRRVRRRRTSRRRLRRRRRVGIVMLIVGGLIVLGGVWLVVTGLLARSQLQTARAEVHKLRAEIDSGDLTAARSTAHDVGGHAHWAHELTTGPAWALAAKLPGGDPFRTVRAITAQLDTVSHDALPQLVDTTTQLDPKTLRRPDGSIDLTRISAAAPALDHATAELAGATAAIQHQSAHTWIGAVDTARQDLLGQLGGLGKTIHSADLAAHIAPVMLGEHGVKRYFVAFQNEAEARGTGGLPGAFAIVRADHGKLSFERFEPDTALRIVPTGLDFGADYDQLFQGAETTSKYINSNLSPNFPYAAQIWMAMWQKQSGEKLDGAMAVDPTALSYLLKVTGPARMHDGTQVSAANVVALTQSGVYARFPNRSENDQRKQFLLDLARATSSKVLNTRPNTVALLKAAGKGAGERRILVYSGDPAVESDLMQTSLSGAIPKTSAPYVGLSIVNEGGNKLDYYLDRSITWQRSGCGPTRDVTVTVRLTNNAPASGLSTYVTNRSDKPGYPTKPGDNRLEVAYYATQGARMVSVDVDGKPGTAGVGSDLGHPVFTPVVEVPRGTTTTVVFHLEEPGTAGPPLVLHQPLVRPLHVTIDDAKCG